MGFVYAIIAVLLLLLVAVCAGCTYVTNEKIDQPFTGLRHTSQANPGATLCILFVHGIGGYSEDDPAPLIAAIKTAFNLHVPVDGAPIEMYPTTTADPASLQRQILADDVGNETRFYTLHWEPVSQAIKSQYLSYDFGSPTDATRLSLDRSARQGFMYGCLTDVVVYAGVGKDKIQDSVKRALKIMHKDVEARTAGKKKYRYVIVTWSLGSKIAFDCLYKPVATTQPSPTQPGPAEDEATFDAIAKHTDSVFMLANQLPLLALIDQKPTTNPVTAAASAEGFEGFVRRRKSAAAAAPDAATATPPLPLTVVAFSDPNDLLSYPIPDWLVQRVPQAHFANVSISVANWAAFIPFVQGGGWTINPVTAHTAHGSNKEVLRLIIEGGAAK